MALASIDLSGCHPLLRKVSITVACDVNNPLCGPQGASAIFGPQKGATAEMVNTPGRGAGKLGPTYLSDYGT